MSSKKVMASGVFDIIHPGHLYYLEQARKLGDRLVVVVATDKVARNKKRKPVLDQKDRLKLVRALRVVDEACLGAEGDRFEIVRQVKPAIIALGYDQKDDPMVLARQLAKAGLKIEVKRIDKYEGQLAASSKIMHKVKTEH